MTTQTAKLNYLRIAPRKVRSVADLIRGMSVNNAEAQLLITRRRPAQPILKLLRSAIANAKNKQMNPDHLIAEIRVDNGPMLKRIMPRARRFASQIQKKMSHVTIVLGVNPKLVSKFTLAAAKKKKLAKEPKADKEKPARKHVSEQEPEMLETAKRKHGFFRRTFGGKSGSGK